MAANLTAWIALDALRLFGRHGALPLEQRVGNSFVIDVRLRVSLPEAAYRDDRLEATVNYAEVAACIKRRFNRPAALIECVAYGICQDILAQFPLVEAVELRLAKENPPMGLDCAQAAVELTLTR